jgi:hypothetical protein
VNYSFANGTLEQRKLWAAASNLLLNYPAEAIGLDVTVEFVDPSEVGNGHTGLAVTQFTYDSSSSTQKVRMDAPGYGSQRKVMEALAASLGLPYNVTRFYMETAAHELGHSAFAALDPQRRLEICRMFGVNTDSIAVIEPEDADWTERIIEGIAETFKEAFLPARHRIFPNRTQRRIPYTEFPNFRRIFRGSGNVGGGPVGGGFSYVYGGAYPWSVDLSKWGIGLPAYQGERDDEAFVFYTPKNGQQCLGVDMSQFKESSHLPFTITEEEGGAT